MTISSDCFDLEGINFHTLKVQYTLVFDINFNCILSPVSEKKKLDKRTDRQTQSDSIRVPAVPLEVRNPKNGYNSNPAFNFVYFMQP